MTIWVLSRSTAQAYLWPSELVTIGLLFALKGGYFRAFYRWLSRDYGSLFGQLPERTRLQRQLAVHQDWCKHFLADPTFFTVIDSYAIRFVGHIQEFVGPKPEAGADAMGYAPAVPPYTYGSHNSKPVSLLRAAGHYDVKLPREDWVKLVTWVDANAPYYGSYFGRRNIAYRDRPDFRPVPTLESALGLPSVTPD